MDCLEIEAEALEASGKMPPGQTDNNNHGCCRSDTEDYVIGKSVLRLRKVGKDVFLELRGNQSDYDPDENGNKGQVNRHTVAARDRIGEGLSAEGGLVEPDGHEYQAGQKHDNVCQGYCLAELLDCTDNTRCHIFFSGLESGTVIY